MKFDELLAKRDASINSRLYKVKTKDESFPQFVEEINNIIVLEQIDSKINTIEQLFGHYNQLLVRIEDILDTFELSKTTSSKEKLITEFDDIKSLDNTKTKIKKLDTFYQELITLYNNLITKVNTNLNNTELDEYNSLINQVNEGLDKLNDMDVNINILEEIVNIYKNIITNKNRLINMHLLLDKLNSLFINKKDQGNVEGNEMVFDLFAKINDQIISASFLNQGDLIYALYKLEDGSNYYSIVKSEKEILALDQTFSNLGPVTMTKNSIISTCYTIINNACIYYNLNEYMRYIEMSYKKNMTKEIDDTLLEYKKRLTNLENVLKSQLDFIDSISLVVNHKKSPKYPNLVYNGENIDYMYKNNFNSDSKDFEIKRLIIDVLLNHKTNSSFDTKSILRVLYSNEKLKELFNSDFNKVIDKPIINICDSLSKDTNSNNITTNYEKIDNYLENRRQELSLLITSPKINVTLSRNNDNLYKDINTVFDLVTASIICDKTYQKGQGFYAVSDFLKTGQVTKFTSKYGSRNLVKEVDRSNYLKLLLENILKMYLMSEAESKEKEIYKNLENVFSFLKEELGSTNLTVNKLLDDLLNNTLVLEEAINNFNYDYLSTISKDSKEVQEVLSREAISNFETKVIIDNILAKLKKTTLD